MKRLFSLSIALAAGCSLAVACGGTSNSAGTSLGIGSGAGAGAYYCSVTLSAANGGGTGCYTCSVGYVPSSGKGDTLIGGCGNAGTANTLDGLETACSSLVGTTGTSALATDCPTSSPIGCCETMTKVTSTSGIVSYESDEECFYGGSLDDSKQLCSAMEGTWSATMMQ